MWRHTSLEVRKGSSSWRWWPHQQWDSACMVLDKHCLGASWNWAGCRNPSNAICMIDCRCLLSWPKGDSLASVCSCFSHEFGLHSSLSCWCWLTLYSLNVSQVRPLQEQSRLAVLVVLRSTILLYRLCSCTVLSAWLVDCGHGRGVRGWHEAQASCVELVHLTSMIANAISWFLP